MSCPCHFVADFFGKHWNWYQAVSAPSLKFWYFTDFPCSCPAVIQLMAAAKADKGLAYFTFKDEGLKIDLEQIYHLLATEGVTVGEFLRHKTVFFKLLLGNVSLFRSQTFQLIYFLVDFLKVC